MPYYQNETNADLRYIDVQINDFAGNPLTLPLARAFDLGDLMLIRPDGSLAYPSALPTATPNSQIPGSFRITWQADECDQLGTNKYQLIAGAGPYYQVEEWPVRIELAPLASTDARLDYLDARLSSIIAAGGVVVTSPAPASYSLIAGDLEPNMEIDVVDAGGAVNLTGTLSQVLRWKRPDKTVTTVALAVISLAAGQLQRVWVSGDTAQVGTHYAQVVVTQSNGETTTYPRDGSHYTWNVYPILA